MRYLIRHGGLYWRPNRCGYTSTVLEAGIYSEAEARRIARGERFPPDVPIPITRLMVDELEAEVVAHAAALEKFKAAAASEVTA